MFHRLRIVTKLLIGFGALLILIAALASALALFGVRSKAALATVATYKDAEALDQRAGRRFEEARMHMWMALATGDVTYWSKADTALQIAGNALDDLGSQTQDAELVAKLKHWSELISAYKELQAKLQTLHGRNEALGTVEGKQLATLASQQGAAVGTAGEQLSRGYAAAAKSAQTDAELWSDRLAQIAIGLGAASLLIGAALAFAITDSIRKPILRLAEAMGALAGGDLSRQVPGVGDANEIGEMARRVDVFKSNAIEKQRVEREAVVHRSELEAERARTAAQAAVESETRATAMRALGDGLKKVADGNLTLRLDAQALSHHAQIVHDFNEAVGGLASALRAVVQTSETIDSGAGEIQRASDDIAARTEQQAARLEESAAALDEITATVKKSADGATHARDVVAAAEKDATSGAVVVSNAVAAMDGIHQSSEQIGAIIGVIDEIAFQTNLLALNAGVEAARAGDSGKGFAVVASEVRALAQRSADAAKQIKQLIANSNAQVSAGVTLVAETGRTLERIIARVTEINSVVADIAAAAKEQATGLELVNVAINQMDKATQENAAKIGGANSASHALAKATRELAELVERFQVEEAGPRRLAA